MCAWTGIIDLHAGVSEAFEWVCEELAFYVDCIETSRQFLDAVIFVFSFGIIDKYGENLLIQKSLGR